jgi:hypothetical protein
MFFRFVGFVLGRRMMLMVGQLGLRPLLLAQPGAFDPRLSFEKIAHVFFLAVPVSAVSWAPSSRTLL